MKVHEFIIIVFTCLAIIFINLFMFKEAVRYITDINKANKRIENVENIMKDAGLWPAKTE